MALEQHTIAALAERLMAAEATCTPIEVPSLEYPGMTVEDGYAIQRTIIAKKVQQGDRVIGKKVGLTSKANQDVFGVREPVYGQLLASGAHAEHIPVHTARLIQPIIECELTFVMRRRLVGPGVTVPDVIRATEGIMPSLELGDARMRNWIGRATAADILADSCGNAGMIVGGELHSLQHFDLRYTGMVVEKNGDIIATGATGAVLGNPAQSVAWLVNKLAEVELALEEGDMVLAGALTGAVQMTAGDLLTATFGGGLGAVSVKFV
ncbi:MAG: 2-keto-4-pentenoate hydratase [Candidatus Tectomicrobia bacterium]|uniref:2-keto-4-pentenoate hydratase n=1 Tax=Tectimicrobiota bacterium TaxID=2528274 RepID=A0A938B2C0_UNCTE|nr:2-keto-4-pentenoate hydratase [Candidatus Tectomicrobia bacterium]